jgi:hypothetical protein
VLRKDIRSICYYDNRESLTLLGSIPLDSETQITYVAPKDASKSQRHLNRRYQR